MRIAYQAVLEFCWRVSHYLKYWDPKCRWKVCCESAARPFLPVSVFTGGVYIAGCDSPYLPPNNFHRGQFLMKKRWISIQSLAHGEHDAYKHLLKFSWVVSYTGVRKKNLAQSISQQQHSPLPAEVLCLHTCKMKLRNDGDHSYILDITPLIYLISLSNTTSLCPFL